MKKWLFLMLAICISVLCACEDRTDGITVSDFTQADEVENTILESEHIHTITEIARVEPTCTQNGTTKKRVCACGYTEGGDVLEALGHDYVSYPAKAATPTEKGHTEYTQCSVCGQKQGYTLTNYIYPCVERLPSVYDRISIFNLSETAKSEILGMYDAVMTFQETYIFRFPITPEQTEQYYKILAYSLPETMMILESYRTNCKNNRVSAIGFDYVLTQQQYLNRMTELETVVNSLLGDIQGKSDFEIIKYFHNYLIEKCTYTLNDEDVNNAYGALVNGINHCDGFADAINLLCNAAGIRCQTVLGYMPVYHAWNIVEIDEQYYYLDVTANNVDWYNKPLYAVFATSQSYMESIGYTLHSCYTDIVPAAPSELKIQNLYIPKIQKGQDAKKELNTIAGEIIQNKPKHIYIQCDGQEIFEAAKSNYYTIVIDAVKNAYPDADIQILIKTTLQIICIVVVY